MQWLKTVKETGPKLVKGAVKNTWRSIKTHGPSMAKDLAKDLAKNIWRTRHSWRHYDEEPESDADPDVAQKTESLHKAATDNDVDAIYDLVKDGVDVNVKNGYKETALHKAAISGNVDAIRALVEVGADVNAENGYGETALHRAAIRSKLDAICALVKAGADENVIDIDGNTPLDAAQARGVDCIEIKAAYRRAQEDIRKMDSRNNPQQ